MGIFILCLIQDYIISVWYRKWKHSIGTAQKIISILLFCNSYNMLVLKGLSPLAGGTSYLFRWPITPLHFNTSTARLFQSTEGVKFFYFSAVMKLWCCIKVFFFLFCFFDQKKGHRWSNLCYRCAQMFRKTSRSRRKTTSVYFFFN